MDIESKQQLNIQDNQTKLVMSREEIMKAMLEAPEEKTEKVEKKEDVIDI